MLKFHNGGVTSESNLSQLSLRRVALLNWPPMSNL